jgi:hypothetical protein
MPGEAGHLYFDRPGVATVRWDQAHQTVVVEWVGGATSQDFTALLDAEITALKDHRSVRLLADCRRQREIDPADLDRADREWVPRVTEAGLRRFAVVLPRMRTAAVELEDRLASLPEGAFDVCYFSTVEQAREWLEQPLE